MVDFSDFDNAVLEFMREFGFIATYEKQNGNGTYDTTTGENVVEIVSIPVEAIIIDLTKPNNGLGSKFGTEILAGDKEIYIRPPEKTDPLRTPLVIDHTTDNIVANGVRYNIVVVKEVNPTTTNAIMYNILIRR